ncbi:MAG TPA: type IV toxin-antitoxin system AbiEi family antitoxin [Chloroflexota bacterium]|nr:type IV toxin-antitoxin system AbiEi family antitoxin [Chloroflexota bacterium]
MNDRIRYALWNALSDIADEVDIRPPRGETDVYEARIRVGGLVHVTNIVWAAEGWPEDVSRVLEGYDRHNGAEPLVVVARSLSPGSLERIARQGLGWVDEAGAARVVLPSGLAVYRERSMDTMQAPASFTWTPAATAVGEALLTTADASVRSLHGITGVSLGRISRILQAFDAEGFTRKGLVEEQIQIKRTLEDREGLLRAWAPAAGNQQRHRWTLTRPERDPLRFFTEEIAPLLGPQGTWALTGPAAAQLEAPFLTTLPTVHVYVDSGFPDRLRLLQRSAGLVPVEQGARFDFWSATTTTLRLSRPAISQPELPIADLPRVYADLLALGGRYEEAAGHLREVTRLGW